MITLRLRTLHKLKSLYLCDKRTNWVIFKQNLQKRLVTDISLKTAVENVTQTIQAAAWEATTELPQIHIGQQ